MLFSDKSVELSITATYTKCLQINQIEKKPKFTIILKRFVNVTRAITI